MDLPTNMAIDVPIYRVPDATYTHERTRGYIQHILQVHNPEAILLRFKNTSILFLQSQDYSIIDGDFEVVESSGFRYLASAEEDYEATEPHTLQLLEAVPLLKAPEPLAPTEGVTIIIPIYGSTYYSRRIADNLTQLRSELRGLGCTVIISVDHQSDTMTRKHLGILSVNLDVPVHVFAQERNLGFVENCNFLFQKAQTDLVVLWTSDVKIPGTGLSRLIRPLLLHKDVALATPYAYGGANLEAPANSFLSWRDFDAAISNIPPMYPVAETNVGYLLAVDNSKLQLSVLFDRSIENGYGDDSDLYYRALNKNLRGVLVDNLCVYHDHGASFAHTGRRAALQAANFAQFMRKWGRAYTSRSTRKLALLDRCNSKTAELADLYWSLSASPTVATFILPTDDRRIGGVKAVCNLAEKLHELGYPARGITLRQSAHPAGTRPESALVPLSDELLSSAVLERTGCLVATSSDTVPVVQELARKHRLRTAYFVQGPEFSFSEGRNLRRVVSAYRDFDLVWTVSSFLKEIIDPWCNGRATVVPYGPERDKYYNLEQPREERSIAVQFNGRLDKGADYVASAIMALKPLGYTFYSFGDEASVGRYSNFCHHLGFLDYKGKVDLFNRVEFYLDGSHYEGLGLLLIESTRCGAVPIYRSNGGSSYLLKKHNAGCLFGDYADLHESTATLESLRLNGDLSDTARTAADALAGHHLEAAAKTIIKALADG